MPTAQHAGNNRLSCKSEPVLYLAKEPETAVAESRPWKLGWLSVATFRLKRDVSVADLRIRETHPEQYATFANFFEDAICLSVSYPNHPDDELSYSSTQVLASHIRKQGYDGIGYCSALYETENACGENFMFFDVEVADVAGIELVQVESLKYQINVRRENQEED